MHQYLCVCLILAISFVCGSVADAQNDGSIQLVSPTVDSTIAAGCEIPGTTIAPPGYIFTGGGYIRNPWRAPQVDPVIGWPVQGPDCGPVLMGLPAESNVFGTSRIHGINVEHGGASGGGAPFPSAEYSFAGGVSGGGAPLRSNRVVMTPVEYCPVEWYSPHGGSSGGGRIVLGGATTGGRLGWGGVSGGGRWVYDDLPSKCPEPWRPIVNPRIGPTIPLPIGPNPIER